MSACVAQNGTPAKVCKNLYILQYILFIITIHASLSINTNGAKVSKVLRHYYYYIYTVSCTICILYIHRNGRIWIAIIIIIKTTYFIYTQMLIARIESTPATTTEIISVQCAYLCVLWDANKTLSIWHWNVLDAWHLVIFQICSLSVYNCTVATNCYCYACFSIHQNRSFTLLPLANCSIDFMNLHIFHDKILWQNLLISNKY